MIRLAPELAPMTRESRDLLSLFVRSTSVGPSAARAMQESPVTRFVRMPRYIAMGLVFDDGSSTLHSPRREKCNWRGVRPILSRRSTDRGLAQRPADVARIAFDAIALELRQSVAETKAILRELERVPEPDLSPWQRRIAHRLHRSAALAMEAPRIRWRATINLRRLVPVEPDESIRLYSDARFAAPSPRATSPRLGDHVPSDRSRAAPNVPFEFPSRLPRWQGSRPSRRAPQARSPTLRRSPPSPRSRAWFAHPDAAPIAIRPVRPLRVRPGREPFHGAIRRRRHTAPVSPHGYLRAEGPAAAAIHSSSVGRRFPRASQYAVASANDTSLSARAASAPPSTTAS